MTSDTTEHPFPETAGIPFFEDAKLVYGEREALIIGHAMVTGAKRSAEILSFADFSATKLQLGVMQPPTNHDRGYAAHMWASPESQTITIMCNPDATYLDIVEDLASIPHEFGHLAHAQMNPKFRNNPGRYRLFAAAITEGVARCVEYEVFGELYKEDRQWEYSQDQTLTTEISYLLTAATGGPNDIWSFLYGQNPDLPCPYYAGHYIVSSLATYEGYDLRQIMETPLQTYVDFARHELT